MIVAAAYSHQPRKRDTASIVGKARSKVPQNSPPSSSPIRMTKTNVKNQSGDIPLDFRVEKFFE
jgi:hypothetical protein